MVVNTTKNLTKNRIIHDLIFLQNKLYLFINITKDLATILCTVELVPLLKRQLHNFIRTEGSNCSINSALINHSQ